MDRFQHLTALITLFLFGICHEVAFAQQSEEEILAVVRMLTARQGELNAETYGTLCIDGAVLAANLRRFDMATDLMEKGRVHSEVTHNLYAERLFFTELMMGQTTRAFALLETMSLKGSRRDNFLLQVLAAEPTISTGQTSDRIISKIESPLSRRSAELRRAVHAFSDGMNEREKSRQLLLGFRANSGALSDAAWCVALASLLRDAELFDHFLKRLNMVDDGATVMCGCARLLARVGEFENALKVVDKISATDASKIYVDDLLTGIGKQICLKDPSDSMRLLDTMKQMCVGGEGPYIRGSIAEVLFSAGNDQLAESFLDGSAPFVRFSALQSKQIGIVVHGKEQDSVPVLREMADYLESETSGDAISLQTQVERALWLSTAYYQVGHVKECRYWSDRAKEATLQFPKTPTPPFGYSRNGLWVLVAEAARNTQRSDDYEFAFAKIAEAIKGDTGIATWGNPQGKGWEVLPRLTRLTVRRLGPVEASKFLGPLMERSEVSFDIVASEIGASSPDLPSLISAASVYPRDRRRQFLMIAIQSLVPQIVQSVSPSIF